MYVGEFFWFFFIWVLRPFQEYFTYIEPFIEGGRKPENPEKNHLTIRKQNLLVSLLGFLIYMGKFIGMLDI